MPDFPRSQVGVAFPAYQTPGGLLPQEAREHQSDYAETQGQAQVISRRTDGVWTDLPFSPSRCVAVDGAVWEVAKKDYFARYKVVGAELHLSFHIIGVLTLVPSGHLELVLPERLRSRVQAYSAIWGIDVATEGAQVAKIATGVNVLELYRGDGQPWPVGPNRSGGQIVIEVEEF